jgi:membrane protein implicated in regulation of membrane protease activity
MVETKRRKRDWLVFSPLLIVIFMKLLFTVSTNEDLLKQAKQIFGPLPQAISSETNAITYGKAKPGTMLYYESIDEAGKKIVNTADILDLVLPFLGLSLFWILPLKQALIFYSVILILSGFILRSATQARRRKVTTGLEGMIGSEAEVIRKNNGALKVSCHGEIWDAISSEDISVGERAKILGIQRMEKWKLLVGRASDENDHRWVPKVGEGGSLGQPIKESGLKTISKHYEGGEHDE